MAEPFLIVIVLVAIVGIGISFSTLAWPFHVLGGLSREGMWFHHAEDDALSDQPDGNRDANIPRPRLRGRA